MHVLVFVVAIGLFISGAWFGFEDKVGAQSANYAAGILCLIFTFLPSFKNFSGLGVKAELLDKKVEEAEDLMKMLREISAPIAGMVISSSARMGRLNGPTPRKKLYDFVIKIEAELEKCGVDSVQLEEAKNTWHFYNLIDLALPLYKSINESLQQGQREREKALSSFPMPITDENRAEHERVRAERNAGLTEISVIRSVIESNDRADWPDVFVQAITTSELLTPEIKESLLSENADVIQDIEYYVRNNKFRRLDIWFEDDLHLQ